MFSILAEIFSADGKILRIGYRKVKPLPETAFHKKVNGDRRLMVELC